MYDIEIEKLIEDAKSLVAQKNYVDGIKRYIQALKLMRAARIARAADEMWCKKIIWMTCNGMGIAYAKLGHVDDVIDNFADAIIYAPNNVSRNMSTRNLEMYLRAVKQKSGIDYQIVFILKERLKTSSFTDIC